MAGEPEVIARVRQTGAIRLQTGNPFEPLARGERIIHVNDARELPGYRKFAATRERIDAAGVSTWLAVALRKEDALVGAFAVFRREVRPFSEGEIALLENFAAQAVIAMENARLLTETREALEQQTATAEVLQVINGSPGNIAPVFDAILERAHTLCGAAHGTLMVYDGEHFRAAAMQAMPPGFGELLCTPFRPPPGGAQEQLLQGERLVHIADVTARDPITPIQQAAVAAGIRTLLMVPLRKDASLLGYITAHRDEVRPFSDKQIALLESFAAQAVIAMENARLITETREALEQQTATAEVLQVINSSPGDLAPVFEAILEKAHTLCSAEHGSLGTYDDDYFRAVASRGYPAAVLERLRGGFHGLENPVTRPLFDGARFVQIPNLGEIEHPIPKAVAALGGFRTALFVPLRKDGKLLGHISASRQEVRPFAEREIALLENFAAQAVIAMENARLLTETREALEQQTATAEVLQVINASPGELGPVFDAILEKAHSLCGAEHGTLVAFDGEMFRAIATRGLPPPFETFLRGGFPRPPGSAADQLMRGESVHIYDVREAAKTSPPELARLQMQAADLAGTRTIVMVPLCKDAALLGYIAAYRQEVRPFTDKEIALLQNFAAQAVIAIENARLLDEIRQRQAELRVTFDNMADGVAMFDQALRLAAWNRNFQQLLQLPDNLLIERPAFDTHIRYLTERGEFGETDPETQIERLRARLSEHFSFERTRPDGTVIEVRHNPMPDGGIILIFSDITERKRSEAEIRAARDAAEAAYRDLKTAQASLIQAEKMASLGQLTAGIAHEIKNPLNFVNNFAGLSVELLDELKQAAAPAIDALDQDTRAEIDETIDMLTSNLEKIAEHGKRADGIVTSMLEHSRGASGERRAVDLNNLVDEALNLAYHGGRAQDQSFNVTLERDYDTNIAPIELVPQDITRVCLNLIGNGFYAARKREKETSDPQFKPTLKVSTRDLGDAVEICIRDNGIGIPDEIKDKLCQPFFTTKPTGEGTGLGLSISYDIVTQEHGGAITVDSRLGEFTEFTIRLPRVQMASAEAAS